MHHMLEMKSIDIAYMWSTSSPENEVFSPLLELLIYRQQG